MAKIIDGDDLDVGTEITIDTAAKTFTLVVAGTLVAKDGVTLQALYSKFIKLWETSAYNKFPFPMYAIDAKSGQFQFGTDGGTYNGWKPANDATRQMLRDGGWSEYSSAGVLNRQYVGIASLGGVNTGAQLYYQRASGDAASNFTFDDEVNEGIQVYGDVTNGNFDKRTFFKGFVREYSYKYKDSVLADTGQTATGAYTVNVLLSNESDLDITANDAAMTEAPYDKIGVKYFSGAFSKDVDLVGTARNFGIVIDVGTHSGIDGSMSAAGNTLTSAAAGITGADYTGGTLTVHEGTNKGVYTISGTPTGSVITITGTFAAAESNSSFTLQRATPVSASLAQIYTKVQYLLRQDTDIDSTGGTVNGKTASLLLNFVGSDLKCGFYNPTNPNGGGSGVIIQGIRDADINSVTLYDNTGTALLFPYASAGTLNFNSFLQSGGTGYYRMYFTNDDAGNNLGYDYGTSNAITVNDKDGNPITGTISSASVAFSYDFTNNVQRGAASANDEAPVTIVAGNKGIAKPVVATGTISASKGLSFSLVAEQDRAYVA